MPPVPRSWLWRSPRTWGCHLPTARSVQAALFQIQQLVDGLPHYPFEEVHGSYTLRKEPIGVCGLIPPWNYPALQMTEKVAQRWRPAAP